MFQDEAQNVVLICLLANFLPERVMCQNFALELKNIFISPSFLLQSFDFSGTLFFTSLNPRGERCEIEVVDDTFTGCWADDGLAWDTEVSTEFTFDNGVLVEEGSREPIFVRLQGIGNIRRLCTSIEDV